MKKKLMLLLKIIVGLMVLLVIAAAVVLTQFKIETIQVTGNVHYTEEEMKDIVMEHGYIDNSLILYWMHKMNPIEGVPFIAKIDIEYISPHVITITVYEKSIAGCITYMNRYVYFDKDGIVLDTSKERLEDIPCISGMNFDSVVMHEKMPIDDEKRFSLILNMTQLITKYELPVDDVRFTSTDEVIIYVKDVKILLGTGENIEEKMVDLGNILASLGDKKGTLDMREFTRDKGNASFQPE